MFQKHLKLLPGIDR